MKIASTYYYPKFSRLPAAVDGFTVAHVSDLHNANLHGLLEKKVAEIKPDITVITGDIIHVDGDYAHSLTVATALAEISPTYYVSGNHESVLSCFKEFADKMRAVGVKILDSETEMLRRSDGEIALIGMSDPTFFTAPQGGVKKDAFKQRLDELLSEIPDGTFRMVLSHRPELHEFYASRNIDLTFTGHAHGGQVRFPLIGALYAPNQGLFPRYTDGMKRGGEQRYTVISRGLGKSNPVPRIFNPPELVTVILRAESNFKKQK